MDLLEVASRVARFIEPTARAGAVTVTITPPDGAPPQAKGDVGFVEHIVLNLLKNAIEALPAGGRVTLRVAALDAGAALEVLDDGPGLAAEAQARLFTPYATTKGAAGSGLGLVVSQRLARAQSGELTLVPSARGAHWRLVLPEYREKA
jgi:signal transduction histidine kinase